MKVASAPLLICFFAPLIAYAQNNSNTSDDTGEKTAKLLTELYNRTDKYCDTPDKPAYLCSGVILRGVHNSEAYDSWSPSPASVTSGGVSFSYLRNDIKLNGLSTWNGFIVYNKETTPKDVDNTLDFLCYFPVDGWTIYRTNAGCGNSNSNSEGYSDKYINVSRECQDQNILTAEQWLEHFNQAPVKPYAEKYRHQCGFITRASGGTSSADGLYQGILARNLLKDYDSIINEFRISTWDTAQKGYPEKFPVQAFFYYTNQVENNLKSISGGITGAQYDQASFYEKTGLWIPIIRVTLPKSGSGNATFKYRAEDQKIINIMSLKVPGATGDGGKMLTRNDYYRLDDLSIDALVNMGIKKDDEVTLYWDAPRHHYEVTKKANDDVESLRFDIPRMELMDAIGDTVNMSFQVRKAGKERAQRSEIFPLKVESQPLQLPAPLFSREQKQITVSYNGMSSHDRISIRVEGEKRHDSSLIAGTDSGEVTYDVPEAWLNENTGKNIYITYAVGDDEGNRYQFSQVLREQLATSN